MLHVTSCFYSSFVSRKGRALIFPSTLKEEGDRRLKSFGLSTFQSCVVPKVSNGVHSAVSIDLLKAFTCFPQVKSFLFCKVLNSTMCFEYVKLQARGSK
jgi:hypothetical protein